MGQGEPVPRRQAGPVLATVAALLFALFAGLGTWQVFRLQWKRDLIARVESRVHAAPAALPPAARWGGVTFDADEYRRVQLSGFYLYDLTTPVAALTEEGGGYWLLTPLCTADGIVLVNRGFIPSDPGAPTRYARGARAGAHACRAGGPAVTITGLLRTSERPGPFSRTNDPAAGRWYIREVAAIAGQRALAAAGLPVAPFFIDAAAGQNPPDSPDQPVGGLTVVSFHNSHLMYALTWYALGLMVAGAWWWVAYGRTGNDDD